MVGESLTVEPADAILISLLDIPTLCNEPSFWDSNCPLSGTLIVPKYLNNIYLMS